MNTVVFIVSCLVGLSLGRPLDIHLIATTFSKAVQNVEVGKLEQHVSYGDYFEKFAKLNEGLIGDISTELFRQAKLQSHMLINAICSLKSKMDHEIEMLDSYSATHMEDHLTHLSNRFQTFLDLMPGQKEIERKILPDIPERKKEIHSIMKYHSLKSLFLTMRNIMDTHMTNIDLLMHKLYSAGWVAARKFYDQMQDQFREEFLNGNILSTVGEIATDLIAKKLQIEPFVQPETWKTFENLAVQIKTIFDKAATSSEVTTPDSSTTTA